MYTRLCYRKHGATEWITIDRYLYLYDWFAAHGNSGKHCIVPEVKISWPRPHLIRWCLVMHKKGNGCMVEGRLLKSLITMHFE